MICITNGCGRKQRSCGLCSGCYQSALKLVNSGKTSWRTLVRKGLAKRSKRGPQGKFPIRKDSECSSSPARQKKKSSSANRSS